MIDPADHLPLMYAIAARVARTLPPWVHPRELYSAGYLGLVDAAEKFTPERGHPFSTYAGWRIRGRIYDELRSWDWFSRTDCAGVVSLNRRNIAISTPDDSRETLQDRLPDERTALPDEAIHDQQLAASLVESVRLLPLPERLAVALHFYEGLPQGDVAEVMDVTQPRVSQLCTSAAQMLRLDATTMEGDWTRPESSRAEHHGSNYVIDLPRALEAWGNDPSAVHRGNPKRKRDRV